MAELDFETNASSDASGLQKCFALLLTRIHTIIAVTVCSKWFQLRLHILICVRGSFENNFRRLYEREADPAERRACLGRFQAGVKDALQEQFYNLARYPDVVDNDLRSACAHSYGMMKFDAIWCLGGLERFEQLYHVRMHLLTKERLGGLNDSCPSLMASRISKESDISEAFGSLHADSPDIGCPALYKLDVLAGGGCV